MPDQVDRHAAERWRLILGQFAEERMHKSLGTHGTRVDRVLDFLYNREYQRRGLRVGQHGRSSGSGAGSGDSVLEIPTWLREVRDLFPTDTCEVITRHALDRYGMTELVTDPETLRRLEPSYDLLKAVLTFKGLMQGEALEIARRIVRAVVEDLRRRLEKEMKPALWGRLDRNKRSRFRCSRNLDLKATVRENLEHWDPRHRRLLARDLVFRNRSRKHVAWHVIIAVDCSGSMADSVIHSAVIAAIFAGLPTVRVRLVAFDTNVVDLSDHVHDPAEVLMSVQLGGGTDIAGAVGYCASLVEHPTKTIVVLVTDFMENGSITPLVAQIRKLKSDGVRVLGLAALDQQAQPSYDRQSAEACVAAGAEVGAMTPNHLATWVSKVIG
ncbi:MAG: VWA domain-containing protein [Planctomycetota bacterium]